MSNLREEVARIVQRNQAGVAQSDCGSVVSTRLLDDDPLRVLRVLAASDAARIDEGLTRGGVDGGLKRVGERLSRFATYAPDGVFSVVSDLTLECMSPMQKEIMRLRVSEEMPYEQIAKKLSMKVRHVLRAETTSFCLVNRSIDMDLAATLISAE